MNTSQFDKIIQQITTDIQDLEGGDLFRTHHTSTESGKSLLFSVHNHIADFNSKYTMEGEFYHTSQRWLQALDWDIQINESLFDLMDTYNEMEDYKHFEFEVVQPGNVLKVTTE